MAVISLLFWWTVLRIVGIVTFVGTLLVSLFNFLVWAFLRMIAAFLFSETYPDNVTEQEKMENRVATLEKRQKFASMWADTICDPLYRYGGMLILWPTLYPFIQYIRAKLHAYPFAKEISPWRFSFPFICEDEGISVAFMQKFERAFPDFIVRKSDRSGDLFGQFHLKWKSAEPAHHGDTLPPALRATVM